MNHESEKSMMFYFLERINYNQTWEKVEYDIGYDLGDYSFRSNETYEKIRRLAKQLHLELQNHFNKSNN